MHDRSFGENIRAHKKVEIGGAALGAALGISFYFGRRALAHRREQFKLHGGQPESPVDDETYGKLLGVFKDPSIHPSVRATMAAVAAQIFVETKDEPEHVLTYSDFSGNERIQLEYLSEALAHLHKLTGLRPNPRYIGGEGGEMGYYAAHLDYAGEDGIEANVAQPYAREVEAYLDKQDRLNPPWARR